jgi:hypothetical protein
MESTDSTEWMTRMAKMVSKDLLVQLEHKDQSVCHLHEISLIKY